MPIYHNENPCILYKGDRHPAALYMGDKLIMGYQRNVVSGESVNIDSAYNDTPGLVAQGKSTQVQTVQGDNIVDIYKWANYWPDGITPGMNAGTPVGVGSYKVHGWANEIAHNAWVVKNLLPNTTYYFRCTITLTKQRDAGFDTVYNLSKSFLLHSGVDGYSDVTISSDHTALSEGQSVDTTLSFTTPSNLLDAAANYRIIGYSERWLDANSNPGYSTVTFSNIIISKTNVYYAPFVPNSPSPDYPSAIQTAGLTSGVRCGENLCPSFGYNKWVFVNGAYLQDGWIYLPNSNSQAYIDIPWNQKASYFYWGATAQSDNYATAKMHINVSYRLNGTTLSTNGYASNYFSSADAQRMVGMFGQTSNPDTYGQAIAQADTIRFMAARSADYAVQPYKFKDVYVGLVHKFVTDPHLPFVLGQSVDLSSVGLLRAIPVPADYANPTFVDAGGQAWVADTLDLKTGVLTRRVGEKVFDGTETINLWGSHGAVVFSIALVGLNGKAISTHFIGTTAANVYNCVPNTVAQNTGYAQIVFYAPNYTTVTDFKSFLAAQYAAGTPVTVDYILATPTTTQLSANMIQLVPGINNIYSIGGTVRPILKATYCVPIS